MSEDREKASNKRPGSELPQAPSDLGALGSLAKQIEYFEALAEEEEQQPAAKKPSKVHSLTQNTTHRKIRVGPEYQAVLPPCPPPRK